MGRKKTIEMIVNTTRDLMNDSLNSDSEEFENEEGTLEIYGRLMGLGHRQGANVLNYMTGTIAHQYRKAGGFQKGDWFQPLTIEPDDCPNYSAANQILAAHLNKDVELAQDIVIATANRGVDAVADTTWHTLATWRELNTP